MAGKRSAVARHEQGGCIYQAIGRLVQERREDRVLINDLTGRLTTAEARIQRLESGTANHAHATPPGMEGWQFSGRSGISDPNLNGNPSAHPAAYGPGHDGNNGWEESPEDYMLAQFERMETKVEDLRKTVTELDGRHSMMLLNETMPLKDQIAELRSNIGVLGMHTTWLLNVQRQSRGQQQQRANGSATMAGRTGASASASGGSGSRADSGQGEGARQPGPSRRMSDGRGEHPPRL